tara:strand:- start:113 stop:283 length:171 start_codon:yes stop_codon:yes gene_type:complete
MKRSTNLELFNNKKKILKIENPDNIFCNENYPTCEGIKKEYDKNIVKFLKSLNLNL